MNTNAREVGAESSAPERARRASVGADDSVAALPDPEAVAKPVRRRFSAEYKRRILRETDQLQEAGQIGACLRREGLHSSTLSRWRAQRTGVCSTRSHRGGAAPSPRHASPAPTWRTRRPAASAARGRGAAP